MKSFSEERMFTCARMNSEWDEREDTRDMPKVTTGMAVVAGVVFGAVLYLVVRMALWSGAL